MAEDKTLKLHLSIPDQHVARSYVQTLFLFPFSNQLLVEDAVKALEEGLLVALTRFPYLAGTLGPECPEKGTLTLRYPSKIEPTHVKSLFSYEILAKEEYDYQELKKRGMPTSTFKGRVFAPRTLREHPGVISEDVEGIMDFRFNTAPVIGVEAFFIPGGLALSAYTHHSVMDGTGRAAFLKHFAEDVRNRGTHDLELIRSNADGDDSRINIDARVPHIPFGEPIPEAEVYKHGVEKFKKTLPEGTPCAGKIFVISRKRMEDFREQLISDGIETEKPVSIFNILAALVWIHVTRARKSHLGEYEESSIAIACDVRKRLDPPLKKRYMGNLAFGTKATLPIKLLTTEKFVTNKTIIRTIRCINYNIAKVDNAWILRHLLYFAHRGPITDTELGINFSFGPDMYMTSWLNFEAYEEWNIPGAAPRPEFFRRSHSELDGGIVFLPRPREKINGVDAPYEILVRIAEEDMNRLVSEEQGLSKWCETIY
ncbi:transferase family-domain-containing protein [Lophiotrema nucula]|uniref:Transferase family-domain-containing protein n=1 Tax=Lophiotrema nucula TaxID=690887 RepID=A0A6A5YPA0_9PLEO|nr:transferase family-domain-containing protein [Lophiotrema nucula]